MGDLTGQSDDPHERIVLCLDLTVDLTGGDGPAFRGDRRRGRPQALERRRPGRILEETFVPGAVVSVVARRHGLTPQQLFTWRREARQAAAALPAFVPAVTRTRTRGGGSRPAEPATPAHQTILIAPSRGGDRGGGRRYHGADRRRRLARHHRGGDRCAEGRRVIGPAGLVRVMVATRPVTSARRGRLGGAGARESGRRPVQRGGLTSSGRGAPIGVKLVYFDGTGVCLRRSGWRTARSAGRPSPTGWCG